MDGGRKQMNNLKPSKSGELKLREDVEKILEEFYYIEGYELDDAVSEIMSLFEKELEKERGRVWEIIDQYPRAVVTHKDGSKTKVVLEHSLEQAREVSRQKK